MKKQMGTERYDYHFVTEFYWPAENATGYIMTRIVDACSRRAKVHVITTGDKVAERNDRISTTRVRMSDKLDKNNLRQRLLKMLVLSLKLVWTTFGKIKRGDTVVTVTNPAFLIVFFALFRWLKTFRLVVIVHDLFPENLVVSSVVSEKSHLYGVIKRIFDWAYRKADLILVCGRDIEQVVEAKKVSRDKIRYIPNFADTETIHPLPKGENKILLELGIPEKFIVLFTGNIGRMQNIDGIQGAMEALREDDGIHWLFIGGGACAPDLEKFVSEHGIANVSILDNMPRSCSESFLTAGDVGLVSLVPDVRGAGVPSKTYTYLAAGLPVMGFLDEDSEIGRTIGEYGVGWIVDPGNPMALAQCIRRIKNEREEIKYKGELARKVCLEHFSEDKITTRYVSLIMNDQ